MPSRHPIPCALIVASQRRRTPTIWEASAAIDPAIPQRTGRAAYTQPELVSCVLVGGGA